MKALARCLVLAMVMAMQINTAYAERRVIDNIDYIHQVQDMDQSKFLGHNSCGPTSACMMARFHNVQPIAGSSHNGWYVYNSYDAIPDRLGNYYNVESAMDMDSNENHIHSVKGAHGFIVFQSDDNWLTSPSELKRYLENHGLTVEKETANLFQVIQQNINAGLPLIGHVNCGANCGHYLVIVGYDTGLNNNEQKVVVNDPYGDYNNTWNGATNGISVTYPLNGTAGSWAINIDWVYTVHPVGIYFWFPGWRANLGQNSQPFVDYYNQNGGKNTFGIPWDKGQGPWAHQWPEGSSNQDTIFLQDFIDWNNNGHWWQLVLNQEMNQVFSVHGQILSFWHNYYGYLNYGEPICNEYYATDSTNGHQLVLQKFKKNGNISYIGYDTVTGWLGEYSVYQIAGGDNDLCEPKDLTATAVSQSQINLTWNRGMNPDYDNLRYRIYRSVNNGEYYAIDTTANISYSSAGLSPGTQYCYKIKAYIDDNESGYSIQDCATTHEDAPPVPPPVADLKRSHSSAKTGWILNFTDRSTGEIDSWLWDFGDGSASSNQNSTHVYSTPGMYKVVLKVSGPGGSDSKTSDYIGVLQELPLSPWGVTNVGLANIEGYAGCNSSWTQYTIYGTGKGIWNENDQFTFLYQSGILNGEVIARIQSTNSNKNLSKAGVIIKESIEAGTAFALLAITPDNKIIFQHNFNEHISVGNYTLPIWLKLTKSQNIITGYVSTNGNEWTQAGSVETPIADNAEFGLFATPGNDSQFCTIVFDNISITDSRPIANFSASANILNNPGESIIFINASTGEITSYHWDFKDGQTSNEENPSHVFTSAGVYQVALTVSGSNGENTFAMNITVNDIHPEAPTGVSVE